MGLKVIGVGMGRTGTNSLRLALNELGFGQCHHMYEVLQNPEQIPGFLAAAKGQPTDWDALYEGYQSCCDWPSCHFWRELTAFYPDAKVILTSRSSESWYKSISQTLFPGILQAVAEAANNNSDKQQQPTSALSREIIYRQCFAENLLDKAHVIQVYEQHNQAIRDAIPANRLLEFQAKDGWQPLCDFLGVAVPDTAYPSTNSTEAFRETVEKMRNKSAG